MFTSIDKALVAIIMGVAYIANSAFGVDFGLEQSTVSMVIGGLTPILVWLIPNRE